MLVRHVIITKERGIIEINLYRGQTWRGENERTLVNSRERCEWVCLNCGERREASNGEAGICKRCGGHLVLEKGGDRPDIRYQYARPGSAVLEDVMVRYLDSRFFHDRLSDHDYEVWRQYQNSFTLEEIALIMGCSEESVKKSMEVLGIR